MGDQPSVAKLYLVFPVRAYIVSLSCALNFFFFLRERESMSREGAEGEGDTEFEADSRLGAVSTEPDAGLKLTNCEVMT